MTHLGAADSGPAKLILTAGKGIVWLRPLARALQRATKETAQLFILVGVLLLAMFSWRRAMFIFIVPLYYLLFHSTMHLEFRYTLPMRYFLVVAAAVVWVLFISFLFSTAKRALRSPRD